MKKQFVALCFIVVTFTSKAVAGFGLLNYDDVPRHMYAGLSYASVDADAEVSNVGSTSFDSNLLGLTIGYQFDANFAVEARAYGNVNDDDINGVTAEVKEHYSLMGRAILPIDRYLKPYALLGYGYSQGRFASDTDRDSDIVYGAGLAIGNGERVEVELEWIKLFDDNFNLSGAEFSGDTFNFNIVYHFPRF
ncbi:porin family protein [Photobacterium sp. SDRW27]|uniref:porin family protein n=1 Tax=Photobacterium obscurum TaxID=2829490 RepID=UPI00224381EA|nr:porin family protein [Photobacterium obscurum]MCW8331009.1 porin family protein [Photobacterium obscurum]